MVINANQSFTRVLYNATYADKAGVGGVKETAVGTLKKESATPVGTLRMAAKTAAIAVLPALGALESVIRTLVTPTLAGVALAFSAAMNIANKAANRVHFTTLSIRLDFESTKAEMYALQCFDALSDAYKVTYESTPIPRLFQSPPLSVSKARFV